MKLNVKRQTDGFIMNVYFNFFTTLSASVVVVNLYIYIYIYVKKQ